MTRQFLILLKSKASFHAHDITSVGCFVAVAQEGTVTKASDAVRLTQSAASMALADLEDGLGAPLFDRLGKRLQLNDLGRFLLPQALEILGRCEAFEQAAKGELQSIDLRLGATLTISDYLIPDLMADFYRSIRKRICSYKWAILVK